MKLLLTVIILSYLIACSPYKKVTLSASERLTKKWKGASQENVKEVYGSYKRKIILSDGYLLSYDYSYAIKLATAPLQSSNFRATVSSSNSSPMLPPSSNSYNDHYHDQIGIADSVIKRIDFVFDKSQHVNYVEAEGFPDSVYYVKRK